MKRALQVLAFLWAAPYTLLGLLIGLVGLCTGGRVQRRGRVIEFYGGAARQFITYIPAGPFIAMTLGHTVLGQSAAALDAARAHELVHVRQYERWGPFIGPAYLGCMVVLLIAGKRPYHDNPFERQAYEQSRRDR